MQSWIYCLTCISLIVGCTAQFYGYNRNWPRFRHANHYKRLGFYGNQKHFVAIENPPNYFNPFYTGEIELQQACPNSSACTKPLAREKTQVFNCANDEECPAYYKCCTDRCFQHKVCRAVAWRFEKRKTAATASTTTTEPTSVTNPVTKATSEYRPKYHCTRSSSCSKPLSIQHTLIFKCTVDEQCPKLHKCCPDSCFVHNVCKPADYKMETSTLFAATKPTTDLEYDDENGSDNNNEDDMGISEEGTTANEESHDNSDTLKEESDEITDETNNEVEDNSADTDDVTELTYFDETKNTEDPETDSNEITDENSVDKNDASDQITTEKSDEDPDDHDVDDEDYLDGDYDSEEYSLENNDEKHNNSWK